MTDSNTGTPETDWGALLKFRTFLKPIEIQGIELKGKKFILREPSEGAHCAYTNCMLRGTKLDPQTGKPEGYDGTEDAHAILVAGCLYEVTTDDGGTSKVAESSIGPGFIKSLPHRVVWDYYQVVKRMKDQNKVDTEETLEAAVREHTARLEAFKAEKAQGEKAKKPETLVGN